MYDASNYAIGVVLGQCTDKKPHVIYYASHTWNDSQMNYTMNEKEFLVVIFAFERFWPYLTGSHAIVFTDHVALKHLLSKRDAKPMPVRWAFLLQEFDCDIRDKKGSKNLVADRLSRIVCARGTETPISKCFPNGQSFLV